jgi:hypothetical protein
MVHDIDQANHVEAAGRPDFTGIAMFEPNSL